MHNGMVLVIGSYTHIYVYMYVYMYIYICILDDQAEILGLKLGKPEFQFSQRKHRGGRLAACAASAVHGPRLWGKRGLAFLSPYVSIHYTIPYSKNSLYYNFQTGKGPSSDIVYSEADLHDLQISHAS